MDGQIFDQKLFELAIFGFDDALGHRADVALDAKDMELFPMLERPVALVGLQPGVNRSHIHSRGADQAQVGFSDGDGIPEFDLSGSNSKGKEQARNSGDEGLHIARSTLLTTLQRHGLPSSFHRNTNR